MKFQETGFRALYKHFAVFALNDWLKQTLMQSPDDSNPEAQTADHMLVYGYIDHEAGLTLEILATVAMDGEKLEFYDIPAENRVFVRINDVAEDKFTVLTDDEQQLGQRYAAKLELLKHYEVSEMVEATRDMDFLDASRHAYYPDDVVVYLVRQGCQTEGCWVRVEGMAENALIGTLLSEPQQELGCHTGEQIAFRLRRTEGGQILCVAELN